MRFLLLCCDKYCQQSVKKRNWMLTKLFIYWLQRLCQGRERTRVISHRKAKNSSFKVIIITIDRCKFVFFIKETLNNGRDWRRRERVWWLPKMWEEYSEINAHCCVYWEPQHYIRIKNAIAEGRESRDIVLPARIIMTLQNIIPLFFCFFPTLSFICNV